MILTKLHSTQFNYIINAFLSLFRVSRVLLDLQKCIVSGALKFVSVRVILGKLESYLIAAGWPLSLLLNRTETLATQASNKVVIGLRVVQFWSQIILVISDRARAEITRMILTKLHSTQFNYIINAFLSLFRVSRVLLDLQKCIVSGALKFVSVRVILGKLESYLIAAGWPLSFRRVS